MLQDQISRTEIEAMNGFVMLEFGASWCGYCQAAQPSIEKALMIFPDVHHIKIEDGKGQRLGRSYLVKLWPTLIFLKDGIEVNRVVRPNNAVMLEEILHGLYSM